MYDFLSLTAVFRLWILKENWTVDIFGYVHVHWTDACAIKCIRDVSVNCVVTVNVIIVNVQISKQKSLSLTYHSLVPGPAQLSITCSTKKFVRALGEPGTRLTYTHVGMRVQNCLSPCAYLPQTLLAVESWSTPSFWKKLKRRYIDLMWSSCPCCLLGGTSEQLWIVSQIVQCVFTLLSIFWPPDSLGTLWSWTTRQSSKFDIDVSCRVVQVVLLFKWWNP